MVIKNIIAVLLFSFALLSCATQKELEPKSIAKDTVPERLHEAATSLNRGDVSHAQALYREVIEDLLADEIDLEEESFKKKVRKSSNSKKQVEEITSEEKQDYLSTAYTGMGVIAEQASNYPIARELFNEAIAVKPDNIAAQEGIALITLNQGKKDEAKSLLNEILEKSSENPRWRTLNALGVIADFEKNYLEAVNFYRKSVEAGGPEEQALNNQGYSLLMAGKKETALKTFMDAHARYPESERIINNLALTQARLGKYDQARKTWAKTLKEEEAWNNAGYVALSNGDLVVAREYLEKAIELSPRYYEAAENTLEKVKAQAQGKQ